MLFNIHLREYIIYKGIINNLKRWKQWNLIACSKFFKIKQTKERKKEKDVKVICESFIESKCSNKKMYLFCLCTNS